ncbi:CrcB family protein [Blastococcus sp. TML/M2B]|uniref:fluoride efflux transporter FluC n=1 Tax=unclassified Blastococcus TaxID=2619396 RepID=UPI00190BF048|nr:MULTISPECIES: CrcB family protein [unclassified Blastococcus]MBN1094537.1 CrcB family protein [Blastococcus sp. TML/M2B]MBN1095500.1 CrcB family protein [Blastococcus sp. TML/C7B]
MTPLLVVLGAMAGAPLRLLAERVATARRGPGSVAGTAVVNVAGSAVLGLLLGLADAPSWLTALVGVGFCGTLTTFSTFGADVVRLGEQRRPGPLVAYLAGTLVLGIGAAAAAYGAAGLL